LFGIDKAKLDIRKRGYSCNSRRPDGFIVIASNWSVTNTVAVSGTALASNTVDSAEGTINNLGLIRRLSPNVIFAYDGDNAGVRAAGRSALIALSLDMQVKVAVLPEGQVTQQI
jgi:DNA primase